MNIEVTYSEAVTIKSAIQNCLTGTQECLADESFKKQYPNCYISLLEERSRCECILDKLEEQLDRLR